MTSPATVSPSRASPYSSTTGGSSGAGLLDADDHGVRAEQVLDPRLAEPGLTQPRLAVGPGVVEPALRLDQRVQAHQEPECVVPHLVVDQRLVHHQRPARREDAAAGRPPEPAQEAVWRMSGR